MCPVWVSDSQIYYSLHTRHDRRLEGEIWRVDLPGKDPQLAFRFREVLGRQIGVVTDVSPDRRQLAVIAQAGLGGGMVRLDSQVKYGAVAAGMAEVYLRPRSRPDYRENIWDHAAGVAVVTEAGGRVTDVDGAPLDFTRGPKLVDNRGVLATNGAVHDLIVEALAEAEAVSRG